MIPILYEHNEVDFTTYGICTLVDTINCSVTEELNGGFELTLTYPLVGHHYDQLAAERIIKARANDTGADQLFRIYRITRPLRGIVTVYAQHISYDLSGIPITPFSATYSCAGAMAFLFTGTRFTGTSDKTGTKVVTAAAPKTARAMLGGTEGSLLDLWGGEYTFDNFNISLNVHRGSDNGVLIAYGKNLTELEKDDDFSGVYTELLPYATYSDVDGNEFTMTAPTIPITSVISRRKALIKDFADIMGLEPGDTPTQARITTAATAWLAENPLGVEKPSLTISFQPPGAAQTLNAVALGDTVTVRYAALGVDLKARIVETQYNTITERYDKATIGRIKASLVDTVASLATQDTTPKKSDTQNFVVTDGTHTTKVTATGVTTDGVGYLPLSGGTVTGDIENAPQGTRRTVMQANRFYVENTADSSQNAALYYNGVAATNGTNTATLTPTGLNLDGTVLTSAIGTQLRSNGTTSVNNATWTGTGSFTLTPGTWLIVAYLQFPNNSTGIRGMTVHTTSGSASGQTSEYADCANAVGGTFVTRLRVVTPRVVGANTTFYINAFQNSGAAQTVTWVYNCVRIL